MTHHENLKIIAFVGLAGSGKTTVTEYFTEKGYPKVHTGVVEEQIRHLADAGQHRIIADGSYSWDEFQILKKAFPGELQLVAIVAPRHLRYHRLTERTTNPLTATQTHERDIQEIEELGISGPIAIADHYIVNDGSIEELHQKLAQLTSELEFSL